MYFNSLILFSCLNIILHVTAMLWFSNDFGDILQYDRSNCQMQLLGFLVLLDMLFQKNWSSFPHYLGRGNSIDSFWSTKHGVSWKYWYGGFACMPACIWTASYTNVCVNSHYTQKWFTGVWSDKLFYKLHTKIYNKHTIDITPTPTGHAQSNINID